MPIDGFLVFVWRGKSNLQASRAKVRWSDAGADGSKRTCKSECGRAYRFGPLCGRRMGRGLTCATIYRIWARSSKEQKRPRSHETRFVKVYASRTQDLTSLPFALVLNTAH